VLGPQARFPYAATRKYTPPDAPLRTSLALHDALGIAQGLVVHANTHGFDNAVDLDAVARSDGRYLAVVRLDGKATREACQACTRPARAACASPSIPQHGGTLDQNVFEHVLRCIEGLAGSSSCISRARRFPAFSRGWSRFRLPS
jgi:predicted TIM-barrel fold metal-dependent hydrolase